MVGFRLTYAGLDDATTGHKSNNLQELVPERSRDSSLYTGPRAPEMT